MSGAPASSFDVRVESPVALTGPLFALDESLVVGASGSLLRVAHGPSGACALPPPSTGGDGSSTGFTALAVAPALGIVAAATSGRNASVWLYRCGAADEAASPAERASAVASTLNTPLVRLAPSSGDIVLSAIAISADGSRVAAAGGLPDHAITLWDGYSFSELRGSQSLCLPPGAVVTHASFSPTTRHVLVLGGRCGLWLVRFTMSNGLVEGKLFACTVPADRVGEKTVPLLVSTMGKAVNLEKDAARIVSFPCPVDMCGSCLL